MSYPLRISVRIVLPIVAAILGSAVLHAAESPRTWTNSKGKTVEGTLLEKGDGWAKILIKGKEYKLQLDSLSKIDQEYIKNAELDAEPAPDEPEPAEPDPDEPKPAEPEDDSSKPKETPMPDKTPRTPVAGPVGEAVGLKVEEAEPVGEGSEDGKYEPERVKIDVSGVPKAGVHCILVWMAHFRSGGGVQPHSTSQDYFVKDGEYFIQELFSTNSQSGANYKGYAIRLLNTKYEKVAELASDPTYLVHLDDSQRRLFPNTLPDPEEDK